MMKKFSVVLVVFAMVCMSSMAFAADMSLGGSMTILNRMFVNEDMNKDVSPATNTDNYTNTMTRTRVDVNAKAGDVKAKVTFENDYDTWGRFEAIQGTTDAYVSTTATGTAGLTAANTSKGKVSRLGLRESWMLFPIGDTGVNIKGGHMLLQLGQGQFFRSQRYGSDAWVAYKDIDTLHLGFVNVKVSEGTNGKNEDDVDAYVLVATNKMGDAVIGADLTMAQDRNNTLGFHGAGGQTAAQNIGLNYTGKLGPVGLKAELDIQMGTAKGAVGTSEKKFKGNLLYINGTVPMAPVTVNFTVARGTGAKAGSADIDGFVNFLDADQHYTLMYEYRLKTAAGATRTGFSNTTALSVGAMFAASKNLAVGADLWILQATEKTNVAGGTASNDAGTEIDVKANWKVADNLNWNWTLGYFMPGAMYETAAKKGTDAAYGLQGVLSMTF